MTPLEDLIRRRIAQAGPIPVAEFMDLALAHPEYGYYRKADPLGAAGDFTTSPEISQVFGELIGLWAAVTWQQAGSPERVLFVECGPGRGTLMADALRAASAVPAFVSAAEIHLVETSPALRARQRAALADHLPHWHDDLDALPDGPTILIANEFFDALPVRQLVRTATGWAERCVGLEGDELAFVTGPASDPPDALPDGATPPPGAIFETSPPALAAMERVARRMVRFGGAALVIDYGHAQSACGETLQAVRRHGYADPLADPGEADLTAHVDFAALSDRARAAGGATFGPITQRSFLTALGILQRTERLARGAPAEKAQAILSGTNRLIDAEEMGTLFKVLAVAAAAAPPPAGFET